VFFQYVIIKRKMGVEGGTYPAGDWLRTAKLREAGRKSNIEMGDTHH
jgi:hypothetical protein